MEEDEFTQMSVRTEQELAEVQEHFKIPEDVLKNEDRPNDPIV